MVFKVMILGDDSCVKGEAIQLFHRVGNMNGLGMITTGHFGVHH